MKTFCYAIHNLGSQYRMRSIGYMKNPTEAVLDSMEIICCKFSDSLTYSSYILPPDFMSEIRHIDSHRTGH